MWHINLSISAAAVMFVILWAGAFQQNQLGLNKPHLPVAEARKCVQSGRNLPLMESPTVTHHHHLLSAVSHSVIHEKRSSVFSLPVWRSRTSMNPDPVNVTGKADEQTSQVEL